MNMNFILQEEDISKLILSSLIGAAIGLEREYKGKPAGFKTFMFICLGSTLFTIFSIKLGTSSSHDRIAANIITGIGFLGAGAIFKDKENMVSGLTTATIIWVIAALGMGVGVGEYLFSIMASVLVLLLLLGVPVLEKIVDANHEVKTIIIKVNHTQKLLEIESKIQEFGLKAKKIKRNKVNLQIVYTCMIIGKAKDINAFTLFLLNDTEIIGVEV